MDLSLITNIGFKRLGMMTLLGQHGQPLDFVRGVELIKKAAESADENAPQGAYVSKRAPLSESIV